MVKCGSPVGPRREESTAQSSGSVTLLVDSNDRTASPVAALVAGTIEACTGDVQKEPQRDYPW